MEFGHVIGWDIGGVNTKVAYVAHGEVLAAHARPYELQRAPETLGAVLRELASEVVARAVRVGAPGVPPAHAVTMTAELSQFFRTKRDGVAFVLDALATSFPSALIRVFTVDGDFLTIAEARRRWLAVAAANWAATARVVAQRHRDAVLIDIGTTTTDVIPIVSGEVRAAGATDPERLASGELVYTGVLRTPVEAITHHVPYGGTHATVSAEMFAVSGDVHVWRGALDPVDYTVPTPDGRPATREFAAERLARVICADREMLDDAAISAMAASIATSQVESIVRAVRRVVARHPTLDTAVVTGLGAFLGEAAARTADLRVVPLADTFGDAAARYAPAAAVALLLDQMRTSETVAPITGSSRFEDVAVAGTRERWRTSPEPLVEAVVKLGGGVLAHREAFDAAIAAIAAERCRFLIVPGGGPFADTVRKVDRQLGLSDDVAHWAAVLAMDQYAHVLAERLPGGTVVTDSSEIAAALDRGAVPVLAPFRWLRSADPLPHRWDVTSDSIAAWISGRTGARRLVLVKPPGASGAGLVDQYFAQALPGGVPAVAVPADQSAVLRAALRGNVGLAATFRIG